MFFIGVVIFIVLVSFLSALWSLKNLNSHKKEVKKASEELAQGKVLFSSDHHSSSSS
ncbi:MAG: hypothetical protein AAB521_00590 [Patescibacteria group bacterium]